MRRRRPIEDSEQRDRWIIPYADFITLLFALFAVLYAISAVDVRKFERMSMGIRSAFAPSPSFVARMREEGGTSLRAPVGTSWTRDMGPGVPLSALRDRIEAALEERAPPEKLARALQVDIDDRGLVISLMSDVFFEPGSVQLRKQAVRFLDAISSELLNVDASVRIEGHTDDRFRGGARFGSSWEFSAARASSVVRLLVERGGLEPSRMAAAGYGSFRPKAPNDAAGHRAQNRRVDLVVLSERSAGNEPAARRPHRSLSRVLENLPQPMPDPDALADRPGSGE